MGFYVGSALKSLTCVCLNKKERFKRKSLLGDTRLACLHLNVGGKLPCGGESIAAQSSEDSVCCSEHPSSRLQTKLPFSSIIFVGYRNERLFTFGSFAITAIVITRSGGGVPTSSQQQSSAQVLHMDRQRPTETRRKPEEMKQWVERGVLPRASTWKPSSLIGIKTQLNSASLIGFECIDIAKLRIFFMLNLCSTRPLPLPHFVLKNKI